jgi:alpha-L-fucosidase 2
VIIKMLVGSAPGEIHLLPALPTVWSKGEIQGVLCRGQIEITSLAWEDKQVKVNLVSKTDQTIIIRAFDESKKVELKAGEGKTLVFS